MDNLDLWRVIETVGPTIAAYVGVRVSLATLTERVKQAQESAQHAHARIDGLMTARQPNHQR